MAGSYLVGALVLFHQAWRDPLHRAVGDGSDTYQMIWFLAWDAHALSHGANPWLTDYMDFPGGVNLMWNVPMVAVGALLAPLTLTAGPVLAFNVLMTAAPVLSGAAAYLLLRRLTGSSPGAWAGGLLYGFSPFEVAQSLAHPHMTLAFAPPLLLLLLHRLLLDQGRPLLLGAFAGALAAFQALTGEEMLTMTVLLAAVLLSVAAVLRPDQIRPGLRRLATAAAVAIPMLLIVVAYPLLIQFFGPARPGAPVQELDFWVTDLQNLVVPTPVQLLAPSSMSGLTRHWTGNLLEWDGYLSAPLLVVAAATFWMERLNPYAVVALAGAWVMAGLSLGVWIHVGGANAGLPAFVAVLPILLLFRWMPAWPPALAAVAGWYLLAHVGVTENVLPARLMNLVYLCLSLPVALAVARVTALGKNQSGVATVTLAAGLFACALALAPTAHFPAVDARAPRLFTVEANRHRIPPGSVLVSHPTGDFADQRPFLWAAASGMRFRVIGGYAIIEGPPPARRRFGPRESLTLTAMDDAAAGQDVGGNPARVAAVRAELQRWHVRTVVVADPRSAAEVRLFAAVTGRQPEVSEGLYVWFDPFRAPAGA